MMALLLGSVASSIVLSGGGATDPNWSNVVARFDFDNQITNHAFAGAPLTLAGAAAVSAAQSKFGGYSLGVNTGGTDTGSASFPFTDESGYFGTGDFTIGLWVYLPATWSTFYRSPIGDWRGSYKGSWCLFIGDNATSPIHRPMFFIEGLANPFLASSASLPIAQWAHIAVTRTGTTLRMFLNGVMVAKGTIAAGLVIGGNKSAIWPVRIGANQVGASDTWRGYIDDVRITHGVSLYSSDASFTPPAAALPISGDATWPAPAAPTSLATVGTLTAKAGWGTIKRNPAYSGPALRVANVNTTDEVDVPFDANGYVTGARPYGEDTRVVKVYDQFGTDHMTCAKTGEIRVKRENRKYRTWRLNPRNGSGMLSTTQFSAAAWNSSRILWAATCARPHDGNLRSVMLVEPAAGSYMGMGVWVNGNRLHWRVAGGGAQDWVNTDINVNNDKCGLETERLIGDLTNSDGNCRGYHNGALNVTYAYTYPVGLLATGKVNWLGGGPISATMFGYGCELILFNGTAAATAGDIAAIDAALAQVLR